MEIIIVYSHTYAYTSNNNTNHGIYTGKQAFIQQPTKYTLNIYNIPFFCAKPDNNVV